MYTPYMDTSHGFYSSRQPSSFDHNRYNDLLLAENESLRIRVTDLEKIVHRQQSELMLLQATSADLLRRLSKLEMASINGSCLTSSSRLSQKSRMPAKNMSQSHHNIAGAASPSRNGLSRSMYAPSTTQEDSIEESPRSNHESPSGIGRQSSIMVNVPVGKSLRGSPLRKWMSHQNVKGTLTSPTTELPPSGRTTPSVSSASRFHSSSWAVPRSVSRAASICSLHSSPRSQSNLGCNSKEPIFNASSHVLQLQTAGRSVTVPLPTSVENLDLTCEQPPPDCSPPRIVWAYGYRGKDVRNNVHYLPTGELVYFCGTVVVLHHVGEHQQRHYMGHTSDVKCICIHPNRVLVASGQTTCHQRERRPEFEHRDPVTTPYELENELENSHTEAHVRIWDSITLTTLHVLGGSKAMFEKAIATIAFSNTDGGALIACVDDSYQHMLSVWNWSSERKLAEAKSANDQIFIVSWHPTIKNLIVVCGKGHFSFWTLDESEAPNLYKHVYTFIPTSNGTEPSNATLRRVSLVKDEGRTATYYKGREKPRTVLSICFSPSGDVITGDSIGTLSQWDPVTYKIKKQAHAVHPGGVFALCLSRKGTLLSVGKDRTIAEWEESDFVRRRRPIELPDDAGTPRVILNPEDDKLMVGTSRNTLYAGDFEANFQEIVDGDFEDVTCCVAVHSHSFIAASADGGVRQYSLFTRKREWRKKYEEGVSCAAVDPSGKLLVLGFCGGSWSAVVLSSLDATHEHKESTQPITAVQFSPNGSLLFVATKELSAMIYRIDATLRFHQAIRIGSLSSYVISTDWDLSSQYIRANSPVGHIYHWSAISGELMDHASVRDLEWASCYCRLSYEAGCVAHSVEGITSICRSTSKDLLAVGRDNGSLKLYKCPVQSTSAGYLALVGHSQAVSSVIFVGNNLISTGINDSSFFQWSIE